VNWTCTYKAQSSPTLGSSADSTCREVGVSTQNSGANVLCAVDFSATVTVGWTFNSAGQQVGCEPLLGSGSFNYYSGNDSFFNVGGLVAAGVEDGVLRMNYESQDIVTTDPNQPFVRNWTVDFAVAGATCAPGARASGTTGAVGSVTNSIVQGSF
jgi:hypothetical protein